MQLEMLSDHISGNNIDIFDVKKYLQELTPAVKALFSEVVLLNEIDTRSTWHQCYKLKVLQCYEKSKVSLEIYSGTGEA